MQELSDIVKFRKSAAIMISGVLSHKGAYRAFFRVRCMDTEHLAKVPLGALDERSTGNVKTVLNEDIEKLALFLAHNLPEMVAYMTGPFVCSENSIFILRLFIYDSGYTHVQIGGAEVSKGLRMFLGG